MLCCSRNQLRYRFGHPAKNPSTSPIRTKGPPEKQADDEKSRSMSLWRGSSKFREVRREVNDKDSTTYSVVIPIV